MILEWVKIRDEVTCEVYHKLWDPNLSKYVAVINQVGKVYRVKILDHVPFHTNRLKTAKVSGAHIYEQTCCSV